jgi:hypothetical protein
MHSVLRRFALCAGLAVLASPAVYAQTVPIVNPSFESPSVAPGAKSTTITGWSLDAAGPDGVWNPPAGAFTSIPNGVQIGYIDATSIAQQLTSNLQSGHYVFSLDVGNDPSVLSGEVTADLYSGGTVVNGEVSGGNLLDSALLPITSVAPGEFAPLTFTYLATPSSPGFGQALSIVILRSGGHEADFDNAHLEVAPEPASMLLLLPGMAAMMFVRTRSRRTV